MHDDVNEIPGTTPNFRTELAERLAELVPEVIADGKIDTRKLEELLDGDATDARERFGLFWPGKKPALRAAQEPTTATLVPDKENSKDWDTTQNVFIEGDNLEVLKILQKHYHGKIKTIYIDPPYNTGKDFVYPDNYKEGLDTYLEWTRQVNEEGKKLSTNTETEGRYHSNWLNMMYPRLKLARNLLTDDGAIFISIDDTEAARLKQIADEIFGEDNFLAQIVWERAYSPVNLKRHFSESHDYILCYARNKAVTGEFFLDRDSAADARYKNPDGDPRGPWKSSDFSVGPANPKNIFEIITPSGRRVLPPSGYSWRYSEDRVAELVLDNRVWFGADGSNVPSYKRFLSEVKQGVTPMTIWKYKDVGHSQDATKEVKDLFGGKAFFTYPKPVRLIRQLIQLNTGDDDLVMDFFSGSGTTAQAVMELNAQDGGARRHIQVQLPEPLPVDSEARKAGYITVADIARRRIELAGDKIIAESSGQLRHQELQLDTGFRAFKLVDTNFSKWQASSDVDLNTLEQYMLHLRESSRTGDATADDLLTEILLKQGYSLTEQIVRTTIAELDVRIVKDLDGDVGILAYLEARTKPHLEQLRELVDEDPTRMIVLDDVFQGDDELKTNLVQLCKNKGIELWTV